jgi:outer membrane protein TolC
LQHDKVLSRLATGIVVAHDSAEKARDRITQAESELINSIESYKQNFNRMTDRAGGVGDVLQAIASVGKARQHYLSAVMDYNRAQIQLQFLLGIPQTGGRATSEAQNMEKSRSNR